MLLDKRLQSNCSRLEALVHLALAVGSGSTLRTQKEFADCFNCLGDGVCGRLEDPAEDVLVSLVTTSRGHFRVLEGIWESGSVLSSAYSRHPRKPTARGFLFHIARAVSRYWHSLRQFAIAPALLGIAFCTTTPRRKIAAALCSKTQRKTLFFNSAKIWRALGSDANISTFLCSTTSFFQKSQARRSKTHRSIDSQL